MHCRQPVRGQTEEKETGGKEGEEGRKGEEMGKKGRGEEEEERRIRKGEGSR